VSGFVDALEELLRERGRGSISSIGPSDIALQANRTVALFFQCFKDERGPMSLLVSRMIADRLETSAASFAPDHWRTASIHEIIRSAVGYLVALVRPDDPVTEAAAEASLDDRELMDLRRSALTYDVELFRRLLLHRADELPDPDPAPVINLAARQLLVALDRELLLGTGFELDVQELSEQLVEVVERLLGLRTAGVRLSQAQAEVDPADTTSLIVLGGKPLGDLVEVAIAEGELALRVVRVTKAEDVIDAVAREDAPAVFASWLDNEPQTRDLLHRAQSSAWLSSLVTIVLTSGSANELSMAYALGARVAVTTPEDPVGFIHLLGQLDKMLGNP
jgi:hypothetical protein